MANVNGTTAVSAPVVDTSRSPYARLRPLGVGNVRIEDRFWAPRRETNRTVTLPSQLVQCEETGRLDNFRRVAGGFDGPFQGRYFNDSDVYKWLEAASWSLATDPDPELQRHVDDAIGLIAAAQDEDGYLNTYFTFERMDERWTNLRDLHELYCAGHLIQAAVAHHRATGERALLDVAVRLAIHVTSVFGENKRPGTDGHPEIEMALVELGRETGDARWVELSTFFLNQRGREPSALTVPDALPGRPRTYFQDHQPFCEQRAVTGHAVRALYLYGGATDLYAETGEDALRQTVSALWDEFHARQMYVTGGAGARHEDEAFGAPYELPNDRAYAEACAAIAHVMWAWRMLLVTGEARFADAMETALYNGVISGLSLDGREYFYVNPLADDGTHRRQPWFGTACCPPNIARLLASLPGYVATASDEGVWIHLYVAATMEMALPDGTRVAIRQRTDYPWDGAVELEVETERETRFSLILRIPGWAGAVEIAVNGQPLDQEIEPGSYAKIRRTWKAGDVVQLSLPMTLRCLMSHPRVEANRGRLALARGPLVYCFEQADHPGVDIRDLRIPVGANWEAVVQPDLLGGVTTLHGEAVVAAGADDALYQPFQREETNGRMVPVTAIPYFAWANRDAGPMRVWLGAV
jgi:DUF1680 family protein